MKKRILCIESDQSLGDVLRQRLTDGGYEVTIVHDGSEGLRQIGVIKPDLVLLDIALPTMDGYAVLEGRKKDPAIADIPVIIVSKSGQPVDIDRAFALGVKDYVVKPDIDPADVVAKVRAHLGNAEADTAAHGPRLANYKILWVEDDQFLSSILGAKLVREGCRGLYAKNGEEALDILKRDMPDVVLLDLLLPGMSGFDVLQAIRSDPRTAALPVIVLSNLGQKEDIGRCKELGATGYLIKAEHDLDDIVGEVGKTLQRKQQQ